MGDRMRSLGESLRSELVHDELNFLSLYFELLGGDGLAVDFILQKCHDIA